MEPNPWDGPYVNNNGLVLECDKEIIDIFNNGHVNDGVHEIHTEVPPQPFIGNPLKARVVLLLLNPSWDESDIKTFSSPGLKKAMDANLKFEEASYPFYMLDPKHGEFPDQTAIEWWNDCLSVLIKEVAEKRFNNDEEKSIQHLAQHFSSVEFHGYHSKGYKSIPVTLPSQNFGFSLVENAINKGKLVIVAAGEFDWECAVPALSSYKNRFNTKAKQQKRISPGNIGVVNFEKIVNELIR